MELLKKILVFFFSWFIAAFVAVIVLTVAAGVLVSLKGDTDSDTFTTGAIKTTHGVGVVEVTGEILSSEPSRKALDKAVNNPAVKAIVVRIDSPGGAVGAAEEIYRAIKSADGKKPVVCSFGNTAASGGLYAGVGCRKIITNAGTLSGSIGVILMMPNMRTVADRLGFEMNVIKSGKFKDTGSPFRSLDNDDRKLLQGVVDDSYEQFVRVIAESRNLPIEKVKEFADGRLILGEQAVKLGIADEVGTLQTAAKKALELTGDQAEPEIVFLKKTSGFLGMFEDLRESSLFSRIGTLGKMRLLYQAYL